MGIAIERIGDKYILHYSIDDSVSKPMTRAEAILEFHQRNVVDMQMNLIKLVMSFPELMSTERMRRIPCGEGFEKYHEWMSSLDYEDGGKYFAAIEAKYKECLAELEKGG